LQQQPFVTECHVSLLSSSCTLDKAWIYKTTLDTTFFRLFHDFVYTLIFQHNLLLFQPFKFKDQEKLQLLQISHFSFPAWSALSTFLLLLLNPFFVLTTRTMKPSTQSMLPLVLIMLKGYPISLVICLVTYKFNRCGLSVQPVSPGINTLKHIRTNAATSLSVTTIVMRVLLYVSR